MQFKGKSTPLYSQFLYGLMVSRRAETPLYPGEGANLPTYRCCELKAGTSRAVLLWTCTGTTRATPVQYGEEIQHLKWMKLITPTFELWMGKTPWACFSFSLHGAHKFTFKPSQWNNMLLIFAWWWTGSNQSRPTCAYKYTYKVRKNVYWLLQIPKKPRANVCQLAIQAGWLCIKWWMR